MKTGEKVRVPCTISRGAFSGERIVSIGVVTKYILVAPLGACFDELQQPLSVTEPPEGKTVLGFISCTIVGDTPGNFIDLLLPNSDVVATPRELVH